MNSKKIFNRGLYFEGIRQLKLPGILMFVVLALEAALIPVGCMIRQLTQLRYTNTIVPTNLTGITAHPLLVALFVIVAPMMTLSLFDFLNKRNTSDFYHSVPHTRTCLFVSFMAAIFTWLAVIAAGTTLISSVTILLLSKYVLLNVGSLLMLSLNCLIGSLLVSAVIAIAMAITGTKFNNLVLSGLILFLPRLIISMGSAVETDVLPLLMQNKLLFLLRPDCNIVTGTVFGVFGLVFGDTSSIPGILASWESALYTLILALIYLALGCLFFNRRKSETAASAAPNRHLQAAYRITLTMAFCTIICTMIFNGFFDGSSVDVFTYVVLYIIAMLIYFGYELITTKKWKNLLRAVPSFGIVIGLNIVFIGALWGIYSFNINYCPTANEIKSVSIVSPYAITNERTYDFNSYVDLFTEQVKITDPELIRSVADSLKDNTDTLKEGLQEYRSKYIYNDYDYITDGSEKKLSAYNLYYFKITTAAGSRYRQLYIPESYLPDFGKILKENQTYKDAYMILPDALQVNSTTYESSGLTSAQLMEIYNTMRYEIAVSDFATWYEIVNQNSSDMLMTMNVSALVGMNTVYVRIGLNETICPKAAELYRKYMDSIITERIKEAKEMLRNALDSGMEHLYFDVNIYDVKDGKPVRMIAYIISGSTEDENNREQIEYFLELIGDAPAYPNSSDYSDYIECTIELMGDKSSYHSYMLNCAVNGGYPDEIPDWLRIYEISSDEVKVG